MRAILLALALCFTALPVAATGVPDVDVRCDYDDDLYQHCNVGPVHTVSGPWCYGVNVKDEPAECREIVDPNDIIYLP